MKKLGVESTARASFYFYNDRAEVDRLFDVLKEIQEFFRSHDMPIAANHDEARSWKCFQARNGRCSGGITSGGCASCAFPAEATLAGLCQQYNLNVAEVMRHLQRATRRTRRCRFPPRELAALRKEKPVRLVDVRSREEFEATRIEGAVLLVQPVMQEILAHWPREEMFVIYDHRGQHSLDAAAYFTGQGFSQVRCLRGGIDAWSREIDAESAALPRGIDRMNARSPEKNRGSAARPEKPWRTGKRRRGRHGGQRGLRRHDPAVDQVQGGGG